MFECAPPNRQRFMKFAASLAAHGALLLFLLHHTYPVPDARITLPGTSLGTHIELNYQPGRAPLKTLPARAVKTKQTPTIAKPLQIERTASIPLSAATISPPTRPHLAFTQPSPSLSPVQAAAPNALAGSDSLGNGSIQIALTTYSPSPKPDLSRLPHGIQGDVVLDVTIDPSGNVAEVELLRPLGYGIDEAVIDTVRTWRFRPATMNGVPVSSAQDVLFHFGPV
jgi:protein TonB